MTAMKLVSIDVVRPLALVALLLAGCGGGGGSSGGGASAPAPANLTNTPAQLAAPSLGVAYTAAVSASGGTAPFQWSIESGGALPAGISLVPGTSANVSISGTPTARGVFRFTLTGRDATGAVGQRAHTLTVLDPLAITTGTIPGSGEESTAYSTTISATGGIGPYAWSVAAPGVLPPGLSLVGTGLTVELRGTPTASGTYQFRVEIADAQGRTAQSALYSIAIDDAYRVFFVADLDTAGKDELYSVVLDENLALRPPVKLSGNIIPSAGDVIGANNFTGEIAFALSPDRTKVAYLCDAEVDGDDELYVVDVSGAVPGPARKVNSSAPFVGSDVTNFKWSPDSTKLAWRADTIVDSRFDIFVADVTLPTIVQTKVNPGTDGTNGSSPFNTMTYNFAWSHDARYLAFEARQPAPLTTVIVDDAFVIDTASGPPYTTTRVNTNRAPTVVPTASNGQLKWLGWAPTRNLLLFVGDMLVAGENDLFSLTVSGNAVASAPVKVMTLPTAGHDAAESETPGIGHTFSPDGNRLAMRFIQNFRSQLLTQDDRLFVAPVTASGIGTPAEVTGAAPPPGAGFASFAWSPDSQSLLVLGAIVAPNTSQLARCDVSTGTPAALQPITNRFLRSYAYTPNGGRVVYVGSGPGVQDAYSVTVSPCAIGLEEKVSGTVTATAQTVGVWAVAISADSSQVAHVSDQHLAGRTELFLNDVSPTVGTPTQISTTPVPAAGDVLPPPFSAPGPATLPTFTRDSRLLFFRGDLVVDARNQLYVFDVPNAVPQTGVLDVVPQATRTNGVVSFIVVD